MKSPIQDLKIDLKKREEQYKLLSRENLIDTLMERENYIQSLYDKIDELFDKWKRSIEKF
jgi:hypothetical protein